MKVTMTQHPVGQGGMFCGMFEAGPQKTRWIYDCGSNQRDALQREINKVADDDRADFLFLSHFDSDHISGVDNLLEHVQVREVILPYLNSDTLLVALGRDMSSGKLTGTFIEAASDLAGWFGRRGVETITLIGGPDDDGDDDDFRVPELPLEPSDAESSPKAEIKPKWIEPAGKTAQLELSDHHPSSTVGPRARQRRVDLGSFIRFEDVGGSALNWTLIPYVHAPSKRKMAAFKKQISEKFASALNLRDVADLARQPDKREIIRDCYDALWQDHNLISMTLYSGPIQGTRPGRVSHSNKRASRGFSIHTGWMLTGDAQLRGVRRRRKFQAFYQPITPYVGVCMLPHHGSIHNHSDQFLESFPNLQIAYAAAGPNKYGHPSADVIDAVWANSPTVFHSVSDSRSSKLELECDL